MKIRNFLMAMLAILSINVAACFFSSPNAFVGTNTLTTAGGSGDGAWVENIDLPPGKTTPGNWNGEEVDPDAAVSFPMTFTTEFTGFKDNSKIVRACLLYLNREGYWVIIKDIKNPEWKVDSNTGQPRSIFGKLSVPQPFGYNEGEILPLRTYYQSETGQETFNLVNAVSGRLSSLRLVDNVIKLYVGGNSTPE